MLDSKPNYDVAIIGGGVSGTALLHTLARYTNLSRLVLLEKYDQAGQVNSHVTNNSQTLHIGDIETYYGPERVHQVRSAALMVARYCEQLDPPSRALILKSMPKMLLGVGPIEVKLLEDRFAEFKHLFPDLQKLSGLEIAVLEPEIMRNRSTNQAVMALYNPNSYAVNFGQLAASFVSQAKTQTNKLVDVFFSRPVTRLSQNSNGGYTLDTPTGPIQASVVVVDADAHSLLFAKSLGYGLEYSLIPMAGTFYFTKQLLQTKVYTCQNPKLLFTAVHGDPDLQAPDKTRWGPTVRFWPVLERQNYRTTMDYFRSAGLGRWRAWQGFGAILLDPDRFGFFFKNLLYEIPYLGAHLFAKTVQKICPSVTRRDLQRAKGYGGMRLQRVNTKTTELEMGERKIIGHNIIFNMTPSPGASICLHNSLADAEHIIQFFKGKATFDKKRMTDELMS